MGLSLIFGVTRIVNFAHGSLYMLGAYLAVTFVPPLLAVSPTLPMFLLGVLAAAVAFLGSDEAHHITGIAMPLDLGTLIR